MHFHKWTFADLLLTFRTFADMLLTIRFGSFETSFNSYKTVWVLSLQSRVYMLISHHEGHVTNILYVIKWVIWYWPCYLFEGSRIGPRPHLSLNDNFITWLVFCVTVPISVIGTVITVPISDIGTVIVLYFYWPWYWDRQSIIELGCWHFTGLIIKSHVIILGIDNVNQCMAHAIKIS